jgi:phosphate transport system substrate-binding protein
MKPSGSLILASMFALALAAQPVSGAEPLAIPGSGDCEFILSKIVEAYARTYPGRQVSLPPGTGSTGGIRSVIANQAVLGRVARPLKDAEAKSGIKWVAFARDAVVFAIGERVPLKTLTPEQLADVFAGRVTNWRDVGGDNAPIRVAIREEDETSYMVIRARLGPFAKLKLGDNAKLVSRTPELIDLLDRYKTSIGWTTHSSLATAKTAIRPLALAGVSAFPENVATGKYPLSVEYALVFMEDRLTGEARDFIAFATSPEAQHAIRKLGLNPAPRR